MLTNLLKLISNKIILASLLVYVLVIDIGTVKDDTSNYGCKGREVQYQIHLPSSLSVAEYHHYHHHIITIIIIIYSER